MKRPAAFLSVVMLLLGLLTVGAEASSLRFLAPNNEAIAITAQAIEAQLGLPEGSLYGVTILAVPPAADGILYSEGVEVSAYDYLDREALASCVFLPFGEEAATRLALLPNAPKSAYTPVALMTSDHPAATMTATVTAEQYAWALADQFYYQALTVFAPAQP